MNKIFYFLVIFSVLTSCKKNPLDEVEDGVWNKEKRLIAINFEGQAGDATISINLDDHTRGTAEVVILNLNPESKLESLKVNSLEVSYGATASVKKGDILKLDARTKTTEITVTGANGEARIYTVTPVSMEEEMVGEWKISSMWVYGGTGPEYGGAGFFDITASGTGFWDEVNGARAELDNQIVFSLEGIDEEGCTFGTLSNMPGDDGKYAKFDWTGGFPSTDKLPEDQQIHNADNNYIRIPQGECKWRHDYASNSIIISGDGYEYIGKLIPADTKITHSELGDNNSSLTLSNTTLMFNDMVRHDDWTNIYSGYDKFMGNPRELYIQMVKQ